MDVPSATEYYRQLETLLDSSGSIRYKYFTLRELFKRLADEGVSHAPIHVAGLFAKVEYLLRQHHLPAADAAAIHDTRQVLNHLRDYDDQQLTTLLPQDIKATALLVGYVFGSTLPAGLASRLPEGIRSHKWSAIDNRLIRCIVTAWDSHTIHATEEQNNSELTVEYGPKNKYLHRAKGADWSYLESILRVGAQLNLVRVRMEDDVCMPELIIYEPDYLVNVTTISQCFDLYAESADVHLMHKLEPAANTRYIHLGNLVGQFLDNTVHGRQVSYEQSWNEYLQAHALELISCGDLSTGQAFAEFEKDARQQQRHIEQLIGRQLMQLPGVDRYHKEDMLLEPTFFSHTLGIQGRMDLLWETRDEDPRMRKTIIVEQKSGKGENPWPPRPDANPEVPLPKEQHLVQLNLYRALMNYGFDKRDGTLEHPMLLYSRYGQGLVSQGSNLPGLLLRSIKIRNELVFRELRYSEDGILPFLPRTADELRQKSISDRLWEPWIKPRLDAILQPIWNATELERAYFLRMVQFVELEQQLAKIGGTVDGSHGFAAKWHDTLDDKHESGNIYDGLRIISLGTTANGRGVERVTFAFGPGQSVDGTNFRRGDIVLLYPYRIGQEPDACAQMVHRGSIVDITADGVEVELRNCQSHKHVFQSLGGDEHLWAIEHDMFDSSANAQYGALMNFLRASQQRKDLLMLQREPDIDEQVEVKGSYGQFDSLVSRAMQAQELFLIIGPPGTGKTSYGLLNLLQEELLQGDQKRVLLLSYTNRAVDEMCSKLVEAGIDFVRIGAELSCERAYRPYLLCNKVKQCARGNDVAKMVRGTKVFCATTAGLNNHTDLFGLVHFDLAIVDEASQILEPQLVGLLSARSVRSPLPGQEAIAKVVLIGDHKQLPAVVQQREEESAVADPLLHQIGLTNCRLSLFERLLKHFYLGQGRYDERYVFMLTRQGRMHRDIAAFPNEAFYSGRLQVVPLPHQLLPCSTTPTGNPIADMLTQRRLSFVDVPDAGEATSSAKTNAAEAEVIARVVGQIYKMHAAAFSVEKTVGVIVPYRNQIAAVRNAIDRLGVPLLHDITIDTVERYQGSQRDYIVYGFTVRERYQLGFLTNNTFEEDGMTIDRKLNVAITRARLNMVMVGNARLLQENELFGKLIKNRIFAI